jgi:hypothetical protein
MLLEEKMLKDKMFKFMADTTKLTRDGQLSTLTNPRSKLRVTTETSASISTDYSTSDQDSQ